MLADSILEMLDLQFVFFVLGAELLFEGLRKVSLLLEVSLDFVEFEFLPGCELSFLEIKSVIRLVICDGQMFFVKINDLVL